MGRYGKAVFAVLGTVVLAVILAQSTRDLGPVLFLQLTAVDLILVTVSAAGAVATYVVPLSPRLSGIKTVTYFVVTLGPITVGVLADGWQTGPDLTVLIVQAGAILGVQLAPAASSGPSVREPVAVGWGSDQRVS